MTGTAFTDWVAPVSAFVYVSDETLIDVGLGTPEMIARQDAAETARRARWDALPWHTKIVRLLRPRLHEWRHRADHAARAIRGIECERD